MFERVIVGVDGRPGGRDAIALARMLVAPNGTLTLVHVHGGSLPGAAPAEPEQPERLLEREREDASVDAALASVAAPSVGRGLHHLAEEHDADLLVVGSCSRGFVGRVLLGDDTQAALNGASCAVAVAPLGYAHRVEPLKTIGVGYDGSPESRAALATARELAQAHGARVRALTVVQVSASPYVAYAGAAWAGALEDMLKQAEADLRALPDVDGQAVAGLPGEELASFGAHVELLIVGSRGYGPIRRLMLGSASAHLARHARCALVVQRRVGEQEAPAAG